MYQRYINIATTQYEIVLLLGTFNTSYPIVSFRRIQRYHCKSTCKGFDILFLYNGEFTVTSLFGEV